MDLKKSGEIIKVYLAAVIGEVTAPGFARLKHTEKCGKVIHTATFGCQCSVLLVSLFLPLRVACREHEISQTQSSCLYLVLHLHFLAQRLNS